MASRIYTHTAKDGTVTYKVQWREPDGTNTSASDSDLLRVQKWKAYLDIHGRVWRRDLFGHESARDHSPTLDEWAERHIETLTGINEAGTRDDYKKLYARTYSPLIGKKRLIDLDRETVARALNHLVTEPRLTRKGTPRPPLSPKSIRNAHGLLSQILTAAVEEGLMTKNTAKGLRLPRVTRDHHDQRYLSEAEFERLLAEIKPHYQPLIMLLAASGCRWGEAVALTVGDVISIIHPQTGAALPAIRITKAAKWQAKGPRPIGEPKTPESRRTVVLPPVMGPVLEPLIVGRPASALLFTQEKAGGMVDYRYFRAKVWKPACERAGVELPPGQALHSLRHSHVAWLMARGRGTELIKARLGHRDIRTTSNVYGHLSPDVHVAAAEAAAAVFAPIAKPQELTG